MKPILRIGISWLVLAGLWTATAAAQSLGEVARQQRAQKPPTPVNVKVYTNDNLPTSGGLSEVGQPAPSPSPASAKATAAVEKAEKASTEERTRLEAEWRAKFAEQKKNIAQMQRELDNLIRENKLRQRAHFYNANEQLQRSAEFAAANQRYEAEIAEKQSSLDQAKQKLEDMKEDLRKAGLPASWAE